MAYSELIKSFGRIRSYMRSFYVFGFRYRSEYDEKSSRGYDNERRRIESWLGDYMSFGQDAAGRRVFLSVDSRAAAANPLYRAFRAKSFTDRDIMLHFQLLDILPESDGLPIFEIMEELSDRLNAFDEGDAPDESTVRKKLAEYGKLGLVTRGKRGRETVYTRSVCPLELESWREALAFFSEAAPLGVIGSYAQALLPEKAGFFRFKHHYILNALDSEILCALSEAIGAGKSVTLDARNQQVATLPLRIYISTQTGRQYLLAWLPQDERFSFRRLDLIDGVKPGEVMVIPLELKTHLREFQRHIWGVSTGSGSGLEHLEMTLYIGPDERHILRRLQREKRCGTVERVDETHWRFSAEVYDAQEMLPWVRSFIGRITDLHSDNPMVNEFFYNDLEAMNALYGGEPLVVS